MNYELRPSTAFIKAAKTLAKRYPSFKSDLLELQKSLLENPNQGVDLGGGMRKIRMTIKSKVRGKSGGARVITCNIMVSTIDMVIALVYIYDKADASSVKDSVMRKIIADMGL
ncbi:MAG: addiction module toxin RelE [Bacteroidales bacterium]|nr:addiction module toxin RelE [Bacteroidales bacterium]